MKARAIVALEGMEVLITEFELNDDTVIALELVVRLLRKNSSSIVA